MTLMRMNGGMMHRDISEIARWWTNQSFAGDKGGSFNTSLYLEYLKCKNSCTDYYTTMKTGSVKAMTSQAKPSAIGSKNSSSQQAPICQVPLQFRSHESA
jgi:hypothetical protein